jgi:tetratricopeptide (TPR) repeat protein
MDAHNVGLETDIFSFGLCLWEMLCGRKPYHIAAVKEEIPDPRKLRPDLPESLHNLLEQLVAFEKGERQELGGFEALRERFKSIYQELFSEPSPHSELEEIDLQTDGLNNQGVSYFELGKVTAAEEFFREVLTKDPIHPQATYNLLLLEWRAGRITDIEVVRRLEILKLNHAPGVIDTLLARVHVARFQPGAARELLKDSPGLFDELFGGMDLPEIRSLAVLEGHTWGVESVNFSPDGKRALSGGGQMRGILWNANLEDKAVRLWDLDTRQCLATMVGHTSGVLSVSFSPDGKRALSGSDDTTVRLWDLDTRQCLATRRGITIGSNP